MPRVVPLEDLKPTANKTSSLHREKKNLLEEGQFPIFVNEKMEIQDNAENPYSNDYYWAAKELGWKTLLVTDGKY